MNVRYVALFFFFVSLVGCAPKAPAFVVPGRLTCGDTPDGMVGVISDSDPIEVQIGSDLTGDARFYFAICNRTQTPVRMSDILITQVRTAEPTVSGDYPPLDQVHLFKHGGAVTLSGYVPFEGAWLRFADDDQNPDIMPGEVRTYTFVGTPTEDGDVDVTVGNDDGSFGSDMSFVTPDGYLPLDRVYHNATFAHHLFVSR